MICVPCKKIYRAEKNGVYFEEMMPGGNDHAPNAEGWYPYKLWVGDRLKCPGCGHQVIAGIPLSPIAEHYQPEYRKYVDLLQPEIQINDCGNLQMGATRMGEANEKLVKLQAIKEKFEELDMTFDEILEMMREAS